MIFFTQTYFAPKTVETGYVADVNDAPNRIYAQYRSKPKLEAWYAITYSLAQQLGTAAQAVRVMYNIDSAQGEQLDVIGRIVVLPRDFLGVISMTPVMCAAAENNPAEFGDESAMASALAVDQDMDMSDELYRLAIKSKIIRNNSQTTIDDILVGIKFMLPNIGDVRLIDNEDMTFSIEYTGEVSDLENWALVNASLIPKPQGVKFTGLTGVQNGN